MTSKELIAAAKSVQMAVNQPNDADIMDCSKLCSDEEMLALVEHVLDTVREDDDEPMNWREAARQESHRTLFHVEAASSVWRVYIDGKRCIAEFKTRGEFRTLCRLLGVKLKEPS